VLKKHWHNLKFFKKIISFQMWFHAEIKII